MGGRLRHTAFGARPFVNVIEGVTEVQRKGTRTPVRRVCLLTLLAFGEENSNPKMDANLGVNRRDRASGVGRNGSRPHVRGLAHCGEDVATVVV